MPDRIAMLIAQFNPISLEDINRRAALQTRADNKYFVPWPRFTAFIEMLQSSHDVLEIDGQRAFTYDTQYFDTAQLSSYWDHVQMRRKRFKCRSRRYVDNGQHFFEIKLKSGRGETVKYKIAYTEEDWGGVSPTAAAFLEECLRTSYGMAFTEPMVPTLRTLYQRMTFAAHDGTERITCDFNISFSADNRWQGRMAPDYVLVETKSSRGRGGAERAVTRRRPLGAARRGHAPRDRVDAGPGPRMTRRGLVAALALLAGCSKSDGTVCVSDSKCGLGQR